MKALKVWETAITGVLSRSGRQSPPPFPFLGQVRRSYTRLPSPSNRQPITRVDVTRMRWSGATLRCVPRARNVISGYMRLHHTKSDLVDELLNRGLIDQVTRSVTSDFVSFAGLLTSNQVPTHSASNCVHLKRYTAGSIPRAAHSTWDTSFP
jgi:hypothetical protein